MPCCSSLPETAGQLAAAHRQQWHASVSVLGGDVRGSLQQGRRLHAVRRGDCATSPAAAANPRDQPERWRSPHRHDTCRLVLRRLLAALSAPARLAHGSRTCTCELRGKSRRGMWLVAGLDMCMHGGGAAPRPCRCAARCTSWPSRLTRASAQFAPVCHCLQAVYLGNSWNTTI